MFDIHRLLLRYYEDHVRLGKKERDRLAGLRDANLGRVREGLDNLAEERRRKYPHFAKHVDQGSYAMHSLNQHPDNDYDIDTALIFEADDLPTEALNARKLIVDALLAAGGNFSKDPEARTNAVTVWYADGYHVDLAIYRRRKNWVGDILLEHAGADWAEANPEAVAEWFAKVNASRSPKASDGATVAPDQFRRVVRYLKAFAKSRPSWSLPGGMIISALTAECYKPHPHRDDRALYETMKAIRSRLSWGDTDVESPVDGAAPLTSKPKHQNEVKRLYEKLGDVLPKLDVLFEADCTEDRARRAWNHVFKHAFWTEEVDEEADAKVFNSVPKLKVVVGVAAQRGGRVRWSYGGQMRLPKNMWLRFAIESCPVEGPYDVHWLVRNNGDEAAANDDMGHESSGNDVQWEQTAYRGDHKMICELRRGDRVIARGVRAIRIAR